jgi:hypothetical protein
MAALPRRLVLALGCVAAGALAQTSLKLDLSLPSTKEGTVVSIRSVDSGSASALPMRSAPRQVGSPQSLDQPVPIGAVVYLQTGEARTTDDWKFGAVGTAEMQPWLAESAHEVIVTMDDGEQRSFRPPRPERFSVGQRVSLRTGELEPLEAPKGGG